MQVETTPQPDDSANGAPWHQSLTRYHWFVLFVAALGWLFDTMDQQLFTLARQPAMKALVTTPDDDHDEAKAKINLFSGLATSIFLIGWATGGIGFGILGDRIGRAKTMMITILVYSIFTGASAFSQGFVDFALWRFLSGLGVGGEFAVGVSLVAEVMPDRARPYALGLLQGLSAVGNISAALISIVLGELQERGTVEAGWDWRIMFLIGTAPALVALLIRRRLKEPERWQALNQEGAAPQKLGSIAELFGDPRWRHNAIVGVLLASSGIIGLWAIGFFSFDLNRSIFAKKFEGEARAVGEADKDFELVRSTLNKMNLLATISETFADAQEELNELRQIVVKVVPDNLLSFEPKSNDLPNTIRSMQSLFKKKKAVDVDSVAEEMKAKLLEKEKSADEARVTVRHIMYLFSKQTSPPQTVDEIRGGFEHVAVRSRQTNGRLTLWAGLTSVMFNLGAALGIYAFSRITQRIGRRPAFAIAFLLAMGSTMAVFWNINGVSDVFWMIPIMGFCQLAIFGGYAIYFPELFPTRLRSTGISFCYNVGRYIAAIGPSALGILTSQVFTEKAGYDEPMRYAGVVMCSVFVVGLLVLPFAPETRGQPLPD